MSLLYETFFMFSKKVIALNHWSFSFLFPYPLDPHIMNDPDFPVTSLFPELPYKTFHKMSVLSLFAIGI